MSQINFILLPIVTCMVAMFGCSKDPLKNLSNDDSRIYITNFDTTASKISGLTVFQIQR